MYTSRIMPGDFRMNGFDVLPDDDLYGSKAVAEELPTKVGNQPPLAFYTSMKPGPMRLTGRAARIRGILGEDKDEMAMEFGRRLDILKENANWGRNTLIPLGMSDKNGMFDEKSAENGNVDEVNNGVINISRESDEAAYSEERVPSHEGETTEMLIENAYSRPATATAASNTNRVVSGASMASGYEVGDVPIQEYDYEDEEDEEGHERDLDAEMSIHDLLGAHDISSGDNEDGSDADQVGPIPTINEGHTFFPDNLHSSFYGDHSRVEIPEEQEQEEGFMAREDYQEDHSIIMGSRNKPHSMPVMMHLPIISASSPMDDGEEGEGLDYNEESNIGGSNQQQNRLHILPSTVTHITTASTTQSGTQNINQLTGNTSINTSDSDMVIE